MKQPPRCWCGNSDLLPFSSAYRRCPVCETLVVADLPDHLAAATSNPDESFYGRDYWFSHQKDLGQPDIEVRTRADLPERCLHWLKVLLKYKLPPGRTLEIGSAHGGFVALMHAAGFDATGLELSPWVADFARRTFSVSMLSGPLEEQAIAPSSLDVIALMDVLEHLPDPVATMRLCLHLLKSDGLLMIQTPCYLAGKSYEQMVKERDPFLEMLKADDHLYIFSQQSMNLFFSRLGAEHVAFEPAIFAHYDMFFLVSRAPLVAFSLREREAALSNTPTGRLTQAFLDLDQRLRDVERACVAAEEDRAARLEIIHDQGRTIGQLQAEVGNLKPELAAVSQALAVAEADRAARLELIHEQGSRIGQLESERHTLKAQLDSLSSSLALAEADRAARLELIHEQGSRIGQLESERHTLKAQLDSLSSSLALAEADRAARLAELDSLSRRLAGTEARLMSLTTSIQPIMKSRSYRILRRLRRWPSLDKFIQTSFDG